MKIIELKHEFHIETHKRSDDVSPEYRSIVNQIWREALLNSNQNLFDGPIYTVRSITSDKLQVEKSSYKYFYAQLNGISSNADRIRPLAVTGVLSVENGYVLGLRNSRETTQSGGKWELVPSGSVEHTDSEELLFEEVADQIKIEAQEEIGISGSDLNVTFTNIALENNVSGVVDLIFVLDTTKSMKWLSTQFSNSLNSEYTQLKWIPKSKDMLAPWLSRNKSLLVEESSLILEYFSC